MTRKEKDGRRKSWEKHIRKWEQSGLTQVEYCRKHGISDKCFVYWKKRILLKPEEKPLSFVQIPVPEFFPDKKDINALDSLTVLLGNNIKIEINKNFDPDTLKKAVETLRSMS